MAIYVNQGHRPSDGDRRWKHLDGNCPDLLRRQREGFPIKRMRNVDHNKPIDEHTRRRCPHCFREPEALTITRTPDFLHAAVRLADLSPGVYWVYNLQDAPRKNAQVGMASNLPARLRSRWRATLAAGFVQDGIPWLHDRLKGDPAFEPALAASAHATRVAALREERRLRHELRSRGWNVSSDV